MDHLRGTTNFNPRAYAPFPTVALSSTVADRLALLNLQARRADFMLQMYDPYRPSYDGGKDQIVFVGDGVDNLDDFLNIMARNPQAQFTMNVGTDTDNYIAVTSDDIRYMRAVYVSVYGETAKPNVYDPATGAVFILWVAPAQPPAEVDHMQLFMQDANSIWCQIVPSQYGWLQAVETTYTGDVQTEDYETGEVFALEQDSTVKKIWVGDGRVLVGDVDNPGRTRPLIILAFPYGIGPVFSSGAEKFRLVMTPFHALSIETVTP